MAMQANKHFLAAWTTTKWEAVEGMLANHQLGWLCLIPLENIDNEPFEQLGTLSGHQF